MASPSEEPENVEQTPVNQEQTPVNREQTPEVQERMYKTKVIQFMRRSTPIILQNDNGPCPLIAICNIQLLRNKLNLSPDVTEVSQGRLLSLVADQLIAKSSNNNKAARVNKDQLQRIADAIDLLPGFATGINVDIKFKRINDFEFTRERVVFDLLNIPVYHGWIIDPQDTATANAIGSKSYNTLMEELVALQTIDMDALKLIETVDSGPTIIPNFDRLTFEPDNASNDGKLKRTESGKHESKGEIEMVTLVKKTENTDGDSSGSKIRSNDDCVTFEADRGKDVCSSLEADNASHGEQMNICESVKHESSSPTPDVVQEPPKNIKDLITEIKGELIIDFLESSVSQLTAYGLYRLTWDLQEHELCVLFRNNHFNTMFKFEGALYILVTDQGYLHTPTVVWEKLQEINGDTLFVNSKFKIFKPPIFEIEEISDDENENQNQIQNENYASTFKFLTIPDKTAEQEKKSLKSDMQFLEGHELEQQSKDDSPATSPQDPEVGSKKKFSSLPIPRSVLSRKDPKRTRIKEKCHLM